MFVLVMAFVFGHLIALVLRMNLFLFLSLLVLVIFFFLGEGLKERRL